MDTITHQPPLFERLLQTFEQNFNLISAFDHPAYTQLRKEAMDFFRASGFPHTKLEKWRETDLTKALTLDYQYFLYPYILPGLDFHRIFQCNIPHLNTEMIPQLNGWYLSPNGSIRKTPEGVIIGSLKAAREVYPDLVFQHLGTIADIHKNSLVALNTAFATDGTFIFIPDHVRVQVPLQMVNIIHHDREIMIQNRNLIILGKNAELKLVQCDDSVDQQPSFTNTVTEIILGENSALDHYKLQNKNNATTFINNLFFKLERDARLTTNSFTFNGGLVRNETYVLLQGENASAEVLGLYLMDRTQHVDNQIFIDHAVPNCQSNELFKGILDDSASAVFNGHILVRRDAQKTNAYQNNKNILLTDKATVNSKPFLEIYADDVKCSHGATIGQLDPNAMFYLKSRGIGETTARLLLMYAFAAEIINHISIEPLRIRIDDMVKKRLRGELSICEQCVLHCSTSEKPIHFEIDLSKI